MSRITDKFDTLKAKGEKGLVVYITAGDPTLADTEEICLSLAAAGVDILEIGVPFSDPTADGPVIQAAAQRALQKGVTLDLVLTLVERLRNTLSIPIVLFGYYNPIFSYGLARFAQRAKEVGVDGLLVVDLPPEEAPELRLHTDPTGIDFITLIAPTTEDERIRRLASQASGFLYYISVTGITGTKKPEVSDVKQDMARIRGLSPLPVAVGFGISTPAEAAALAPYADAVVVGSAFVGLIEEKSGGNDLIATVANLAGAIKKAI